MRIKFYSTKSENNSVNKTLDNERIVDGSCRDEVDILNPVFAFTFNPSVYNYCYIESFNRYYYVKSILAVRRDYFLVNFSCDVLMSNKEDIAKLHAVISRQANSNYNKYYNKGYEIESRFDVSKIPFDYTFDKNGQYVLITLKGGES